jgi:hypothetical protein
LGFPFHVVVVELAEDIEDSGVFVALCEGLAV